jgi:hypothetical protein
MFALESAMDEMAIACGLDPLEFRIRNEPAAHPESGLPFSSRNLVSCPREGVRRFGWQPRDPAPRSRCDGRWLTETGVAVSSTLDRSPPSQLSQGLARALRGAAPLAAMCGSAPPTSIPARHGRRDYRHPAAPIAGTRARDRHAELGEHPERGEVRGAESHHIQGKDDHATGTH